MHSQELRRAFADETDAEAVDHALEGQLLGAFDLIENVLGGFVAHPIERQQVFFGQLVDIGDVLYQLAVGELSDQSVSQAINVHDAARREVQDGLTEFGGAVGVDTPVVSFAFGADDVASADGASFRHVERFVAAGMVFVFDYARDFGNHVAATFHFHPVADFYAEAVDLVHVVEGGATDRGATDGNWPERRYRREFAGAPDLHQNVFDRGDAPTRCIFVSDGPARGFAGVAEFLLQGRAV